MAKRQASDKMNQRTGNKLSGDALGPNTEIGRKLRQFYDEIVSDTVPDRFTELLSQLERAESAQSKKD